jgi:hypothetical protein
MPSAIRWAAVIAVAMMGCDSGSSSPSHRCDTFTAYVDADGDGRGGARTVQVESCEGHPPNEGTAWSSDDCDDGDATRWEPRTLYRDADGDGWGGAAETVCVGAAALPLGYVASGSDCDDSDAARFRGFVRYPDADADGVGTSPRDVPCVGEALPGGEPGAGWSVFGWDPDDADPAVTGPPEDDDPLLGLAVR